MKWSSVKTNARFCTWDTVIQEFRTDWIGSSSAKRDLVDKLKMSEQYAAAAKKVNGILSCISWGINSRDKWLIQSLLARLHMKYFFFLILTLAIQKGADRLKRVWKGATEKIKGLGPCCIRKAEGIEFVPFEESLGETPSLCSNIYRLATK